MTAIVPCPKCSQKMRVPTDKGELTIRCPSCRHSWDWPIRETDPSVGSDDDSRKRDDLATPHQDPNDGCARTQLAWEYSQKGDAQRELGNYDQAIADCTQAIRLDSTIGYPWGIRGLCYQLKGNLDQAISDCTEAIRLEPQHAFNYETRAECFRLLGKPDQAMADCSFVIRLDPTSAHAYRTRAGLHLKAQNLDATIADCDEAIRLDPSWTAYKAYIRRGIAYYYKGDFEKAVADCSEAIRLYPHDSLAFQGRADAFLAKGDTRRAIQDCTEAIRLNPKDGMAYKTRAVALVATGNFDGAIADCTVALRINPKIASAFAARAEAQRMKGDLDRAFADFTEAIRLNPSDLNAFCMRGHIYAQRGDLPHALADLVVANQLKASSESNAIALAQLFHPPAPFSLPQVLMDATARHQATASPNGDGASREDDSGKSAAQRNDLLHYTMNTGHASPVPRTQVPSYAIDQAKCMLTNGRHPIKIVPGGYECDVTITKHALMATVYKGERPLVTFGVAPNVEASIEFWTAMVATYGFFRDGILRSVNKHLRTVEQAVSNPPKSVPWCAVIALLIQDGELWLANFEQMVAWAWIEKTRSSDAK